MSTKKNSRRVKDLMVSLDQCALVSEDATLRQAVLALEEAQQNLLADRQPYRAVLVIDDKKRIVGKINQLGILKALEPRYNVIGDLESLSLAGASEQFVSSMMEHYRLFQEKLPNLCSRAGRLLVKEVMRPVMRCIDQEAALPEAIHKLVIWQTLSILVTRGTEVVGLLRLADLFDAITAQFQAAQPAEEPRESG
jgi:CBS domain-containing protein